MAAAVAAVYTPVSTLLWADQQAAINPCCCSNTCPTAAFRCCLQGGGDCEEAGGGRPADSRVSAGAEGPHARGLTHGSHTALTLANPPESKGRLSFVASCGGQSPLAARSQPRLLARYAAPAVNAGPTPRPSGTSLFPFTSTHCCPTISCITITLTVPVTV